MSRTTVRTSAVGAGVFGVGVGDGVSPSLMAAPSSVPVVSLSSLAALEAGDGDDTSPASSSLETARDSRPTGWGARVGAWRWERGVLLGGGVGQRDSVTYFTEHGA